MNEYGINDNESKLQCRRLLNDNQLEILKEYNKQNGKSQSAAEYEEEDEEEEDEGENNTEILFAYADTHIKLLFKDQYGKLFGCVKIKDGHYEPISLTSHKFERYIFKLFYDSEYKIVLKEKEKNNIIDYVQSKAEFNGIIKRLELRVARTDEDKYTFYYDLVNNDGSVIKITPQGWTIEKTPPILFRHFSSQLPQVTPILPTEEYDEPLLDKFISLLNIADEDTKLLVKVKIVSLLIPDISKPVNLLYGEQGSAKSTFQELIRMLIDPSSVKTLTFPRDINELIQKLSHNYIAYFDNVSKINDWVSDALCRAVTGSGFSKRQLYTDDDDIIYSFKRCVGINGINIGATKPDLLDRSIIIKLERIPKENRRKQEDIWNEFEAMRPKLLGYLFNILVKVLQVKQNGGITIEKGLNRMADFEEYGEIISQCLGNKEGEFLRVYQDNINVQIEEAIAESAVSQALIIFMIDKQDEDGNIVEYKEKWSGTSSELLTRLEDIAVRDLKINISKVTSFPKAPNVLTRRLNEAKTNLRERGFLIEIGKKDNKGKRVIEIVCIIPSISSNRQKTENHAQNQGEKMDDIKNSENISSKVSSKENSQNHAQNEDSGRLDDIDDTLHTFPQQYKCNYCDNEFSTEKEHLKHCLNFHAKKPAQPSKSLINTMKQNGERVEFKGNPWE